MQRNAQLLHHCISQKHIGKDGPVGRLRGGVEVSRAGFSVRIHIIHQLANTWLCRVHIRTESFKSFNPIINLYLGYRNI